MPRLPPSPEQIQARKDEIKRISIDLLASCTFGSFTLDQVVAQSTLSKGSVYKLYSSKDELFTALAVDMLSRLYLEMKKVIDIQQTGQENIKAVAMAFIDFIQASDVDRRLFLATKNYERVSVGRSVLVNHVDLMDDEIVDLIKNEIERFSSYSDEKNKGRSSKKLTINILAFTYGLVALHSNSQSFLFKDEKIDLKEVLSSGIDLLLFPCASLNSNS